MNNIIINMPCGHPAFIEYTYAGHLKLNISYKVELKWGCGLCDKLPDGAYVCSKEYLLKEIMEYND